MIRFHEYIYKCFLVPISLNEVIARDGPVGNYSISRDAATIKDQSRCQTTSRSEWRWLVCQCLYPVANPSDDCRYWWSCYDRERVKNENTVILDRGRLSLITFAFQLYTFERKAMSSDFPAAGSEDLPNSARFHLDYIAGLHFVNRLFLPPSCNVACCWRFP